MSLDQAITVWFQQLRDGDRQSVGHLIDHYLRRASGLAANRLKNQPQLNGLEEDVALSALHSLCLGVEKGRFDALADRDELWRLLAVITVRKALKLRRQLRPEQPLDISIPDLLQSEPTPAEAIELDEAVQQLLGKLDDNLMRQIALWKVEGFTHEEIATKIGRDVRTVHRKVFRIRQCWGKELES